MVSSRSCLHAHSCNYCQSWVFESQHHEIKDEHDVPMNGVLLNCAFSDLVNGDKHCQFCTWLLDEDILPSDKSLDLVPRSSPRDDPYWQMIPIFEGKPMLFEEYYRELLMPRTLRQLARQEKMAAYGYRVVAVLDKGSIQSFSVWNPETREIDYRTKNRLEVFAESGDPAAKCVSTRPIAMDPASDHDLNQIWAWWRECRYTHQECKQLSSRAPIRLIEIIIGGPRPAVRLVDTNDFEQLEYATLSYVRGVKDGGITEAVLRHLRTGVAMSELPAAVRDAILVCTRLCIPYLWVDCLCINQDDEEEKTNEIAKMASIYGNAAFTVAAASAESVHHGFLRRRHRNSLSFKFRYRCSDGTIGFVTLSEVDTSSEPLDARAWALQEELLSTRVIRCGMRSTQWYCRQSDQHQSDGWRSEPDDTGLDAETRSLVNINRLQDFHPRKDCGYILSHWHSIVEAYTARQLSLSTDRSQAISGIAHVFSHLFKDQYRAGLWTCSIHSELLWNISPKSTEPLPAVYQGPSWSWTGVNGTVKFDHLNVNDFQPSRCQARIIGIECEPVNPLAPLGAIKPESGLLQLRARISTGARIDQDKSTVTFDGKNGSGACLATASISLDTLEHFAATSTDVAFLEIQSRIYGSSWQCRGLVLRAVAGKKHWYRRVGTFGFDTGGEGRREGESEEDWDVRVAQEFDWFRHLRFVDVTIV